MNIDKQKDKEEIMRLLEISIEDLYTHDKNLINNCVNERSVAFRLAHYLQKNIDNMSNLGNKYVVDCEYNKHGKAPKHAYSKCKDCIANKKASDNTCLIYVDDEKYKFNKKRNQETNEYRIGEYIQLYEIKMIPDIIVHERTADKNNLLAIELKMKEKHSKPARVLDFAKLSYLVCKKSRTEYKYECGVFIDISKVGYILLEPPFPKYSEYQKEWKYIKVDKK